MQFAPGGGIAAIAAAKPGLSSLLSMPATSALAIAHLSFCLCLHCNSPAFDTCSPEYSEWTSFALKTSCFYFTSPPLDVDIDIDLSGSASISASSASNTPNASNAIVSSPAGAGARGRGGFPAGSSPAHQSAAVLPYLCLPRDLTPYLVPTVVGPRGAALLAGTAPAPSSSAAASSASPAAEAPAAASAGSARGGRVSARGRSTSRGGATGRGGARGSSAGRSASGAAASAGGMDEDDGAGTSPLSSQVPAGAAAAAHYTPSLLQLHLRGYTRRFELRCDPAVGRPQRTGSASGARPKSVLAPVGRSSTSSTTGSAASTASAGSVAGASSLSSASSSGSASGSAFGPFGSGWDTYTWSEVIAPTLPPHAAVPASPAVASVSASAAGAVGAGAASSSSGSTSPVLGLGKSTEPVPLPIPLADVLAHQMVRRLAVLGCAFIEIADLPLVCRGSICSRIHAMLLTHCSFACTSCLPPHRCRCRC